MEPSDMPPFTFQQLSTLMALAKWKKQAAVESALGKSQSQISRDLAAMEKSLGGGPLFCRASRCITEEGERVLEFALNASREWERLNASLAGEKLSGKVSVGADVDFMTGGGALTVGSISRKLPDIELAVRYDTTPGIIEKLESGEIDIGIVADPGRPKGLSLRKLYTGKIALALHRSSPLARRETIGLKDIVGLRIFMPKTSESLTAQIGVDRLKRLKKSVEFLPGGRETVLTAVSSGHGAGLLVTFPDLSDPMPSRFRDSVTFREITGTKTSVNYSCAIRTAMKSDNLINATLRNLLRTARCPGIH